MSAAVEQSRHNGNIVAQGHTENSAQSLTPEELQTKKKGVT